MIRFSSLQIIVTAILLSSTFVFGQINDEYRFIQYNVPDTYLHDPEDTVCRLTMDCLAANGYGQWTASSQTNTQVPGSGENPTTWPQQGWFLLGNRIDISDIPTGTVSSPPGIVAKGSFIGSQPIQVKAAANMNGSVRYAWIKESIDPNIHRKFFIVQGFNDQRGPDDPRRQIDISFTGFPNPPINRQAVKKPIFHYQPITDISTGGAAVSVEAGLGTNWRDEFDIAIDKDFLYIVWSTPVAGGKQVWATVLGLDQGTVVGPQYPLMIAADGFRPTVACDVRNGGVPRFSVSCIGITAPGVQLFDISGAAVFPVGLSPNFMNPTNGAFLPIQNVTHARVVRKLDPQSLIGLSHVALYVIADNELLLHNPLGAAAAYVDGSRVPPAKPLKPKLVPFPGYDVLDNPLVAFANPYDEQTPNNVPRQFHAIYQLENAEVNLGPTGRKPLLIVKNFECGAANPTTTDTRLCLNVPPIPEAAVPDFDDEYLPTALLEDDPETYIAAVNQMGIHVHWRTGGTSPTHFYARDINRAFDEGIEEFTLVTNHCYVKDGTSHGGTSTIVVPSNLTMTLWSDPNWGTIKTINLPDPSDPPMKFLDSKVKEEAEGKLIFKGNNVKLYIGEEPGTENAKLVTLSAVAFVLPTSYSNQLLQINPNARWDHYTRAKVYSTGGSTYSGFSPTSAETILRATPSSSTGNGLVKLLGGEEGPAKLFIHGGSVLQIGEGSVLEANNALIEFPYEASVFPTYTTSFSKGAFMFPVPAYLSGVETGILKISGRAVIENSIVNSYVERAWLSTWSNDFPGVLDIIQVRPTTDLSEYQVNITNTAFHNIADGLWFDFQTGNQRAWGPEATAVLHFFAENSSSSSFGRIRIENCTFERGQIFAQNTVNEFKIYDCDFSLSFEPIIKFTRNVTWEYSGIEIKDCSLSRDRFIIDQFDAAETFPYVPFSCISFEGFDLHHLHEINSIEHDRIRIMGNTLTPTQTHQESYMSGILLVNSSASLRTNTISGFAYGIGCGSTPPLLLQTTSFLCSNVITDCHAVSSGEKVGAGILTAHWRGYSKLNNISNSDWGHVASSDVGNGAGICFSNYHDNDLAGLLLTDNAKVDLAGVHSSSTNNYEAKSTFASNNVDNAGTDIGGQIEYSFNHPVWIDVSEAELFFTSNQPLNAKNNFIRHHLNQVVDNFIFCASTAPVDVNLGNKIVNNNFWGFPNASHSSLPSGTAPMKGVSITTPITVSGTTANTYGDITCGVSGGLRTKETVSQQPQILNVDSCFNLRDISSSLSQGGEFQKAHDTLKYFVEHCTGIVKTYPAFTDMSSTNQFRSTDPNRFPEHREWLKKVLYYDPDTLYYCGDVRSMLHTFAYFDSVRGEGDALGQLAVVTYLLESQKCPHLHDFLNDIREDDSAYLINHWRDTVTDSLATPLDTTLPSLEDLDLGILRGPLEVVSDDRPQHIRDIIAVRNPFTDALELRYLLEKSAMVRIDIHDLLGRTMYGEGQGYRPLGEHRLSLQTHDWAAGTYYVRFSTPAGELRTVKVIKE